MLPVPPHLLRARAAALAFALALALAAGPAPAADKKDAPKAADPKTPAPGKAPDAKAAPAPPATNAIPLVVAFPKAAFNPALAAGRDPFHPTSKRRHPKPPEVIKPPTPKPATNEIVRVPDAPVPPPVPGATNPPPAHVTPPAPELVGGANLTLRGISGSKLRRFAIVHTGAKGYTFTKNEEMLIRLPNDKQLKIRCLDIGERSARFHIEGEPEPKELFLREGL